MRRGCDDHRLRHSPDTPDLEAVRGMYVHGGFARVFAGSVTFAEADPDVQGRVRGNPLTFGLALNLHVAASMRSPGSRAHPRAAGTTGSRAERRMDGGGVGATVTSSGASPVPTLRH